MSEEHTQAVSAAETLFYAINTAARGLPLAVVMESCSQILVACLVNCSLDERRQFLMLIGNALSNTLLEPEPGEQRVLN